MSEMNIKFTVLKDEDIEKYGGVYEKVQLRGLKHSIHEGRRMDGRNTDNSYIVINMDEPYVDEVVEILKRNGHWG